MNFLVPIFMGAVYLAIKGTSGSGRAKLEKFVYDNEGGLSRDPNDRASKDPVPGLYKGYSGWHTNRGVTWTSWKAIYGNTPQRFFRMSKNDFKATYKKYWTMYPLHEISHLPRIQAVILTWAWGSGSGGSERYLADFQRDKMGIKDSNIDKKEIVRNFNNKINITNERRFFELLCKRRAEDFAVMSSAPVHLKGWLARLERFKKAMR